MKSLIFNILKMLRNMIIKTDKKYLALAGLVIFIMVSNFLKADPKDANNDKNGSVSNSGYGEKNDVTIIEPTNSPSQDIQNKIVVAAWKDEANEVSEAVEYFKKRFPEITVEFRLFNLSTYMQQLSDALKWGEDIDVFLVRNVNDYAVSYEQKLPADIEQLVRKGDVDTSKYGRAFEDLKLNNKLFGLPYKRNIYMTYYNKSIFEKLKIPLPTKKMTWGEYRELAKKISDIGKNPKVWGTFMDVAPQSWYIQALQKGGILMESESPIFKTALQFRLYMEKDGSVPTYKEQVYWKMHYNTEFQKGNIAMHVTGSWHIKQLMAKKPKFEWDVGPVPHPEDVKDNISIGNYSIALININSKKTEKAFQFIKFLSSTDATRKIQKNYSIPAYLDEEVIDSYEELFNGKHPNLKEALKQDFVLEYPVIPNGYNLANVIYAQESEAVFLGKESIDTFGKRVKAWEK